MYKKIEYQSIISDENSSKYIPFWGSSDLNNEDSFVSNPAIDCVLLVQIDFYHIRYN